MNHFLKFAEGAIVSRLQDWEGVSNFVAVMRFMRSE
jgi:hypothetical protein